MNNSYKSHLYFPKKSNISLDYLQFKEYIISITVGENFNRPVDKLPRALRLRGCFAVR